MSAAPSGEPTATGSATSSPPPPPPPPPPSPPSDHQQPQATPSNTPKYEGPAFPPVRHPVENPTATIIAGAQCDACGGKFDRNGFTRDNVLVQPHIGIAVPDMHGVYNLPFRLVCGECMANPDRVR